MATHRIARHIETIPRSGIRDFFDIVASRRDVISLGIGEPDFVTPWHIREASVFALEHGATAYTANLGTLELREAIADYVEQTFGAAYDPAAEILVTVGVSEAVDLALRATLNPGDEALFHTPSYVSYGPVIAFAHGRAVAVPTGAEDGFRLTAAMLEQAVTDRTRLLVLNFPTNPTGAVLRPEDAAGIARFAVERDLLVLSDAIYSELTYDDEPVRLVTLPGMKARTIFLHGFSKAWAMTGFRLGYACAPPDLIEAMMKIHQYTMMCAPVLSQKAAVDALKNGLHDVKTMRAQYRQRRNVMCGALETMGLPCPRPAGAFYAFPDIRATGLSSQAFALRLLEEENVACIPGTAFGAAGEGYVRCCYATDMELIREALKRMAAFVARVGVQ